MVTDVTNIMPDVFSAEPFRLPDTSSAIKFGNVVSAAANELVTGNSEATVRGGINRATIMPALIVYVH